MAKTSFSTSDALTKKVWEEKLFRDSVKQMYFSQFMGEGSDSIVQVKRQLEKNQGDAIKFGIRMRLSGTGVTSGQILEGNEEKLSSYDYSVTLEQYRHAVRDDGALSRQRAMFSIDKEAETAIKDWNAEKTDQLLFDALGIGSGSGTVTPSKVFYKSDATTYTSATTFALAKAGLSTTTASSVLDTKMISVVKAWAKTGGNRSYIPLRPIKIKGKDYYVLLVHPDSMLDLKVDSTWVQAQREAQSRGDENPLFTGAAGIWDGVVVHEHENVALAADGSTATNVKYARALFMGAQSGVLAWGSRPEIIQKEFDYDNEHGYATSMICKAGAPVFNSLTYGAVGVCVSRGNPASGM